MAYRKEGLVHPRFYGLTEEMRDELDSLRDVFFSRNKVVERLIRQGYFDRMVAAGRKRGESCDGPINIQVAIASGCNVVLERIAAHQVVEKRHILALAMAGVGGKLREYLLRAA